MTPLEKIDSLLEFLEDYPTRKAPTNRTIRQNYGCGTEAYAHARAMLVDLRRSVVTRRHSRPGFTSDERELWIFILGILFARSLLSLDDVRRLSKRRPS